MEINISGRTLIYQEEGVKLSAYLDPVGIPTIGVGFTFYPGTGRKVKMGDRITQSECDQIFEEIVKLYEEGIDGAIKVVINQNQFNALVSLCYNIGVYAFTTSTLVRSINIKAPIAEIERWFLAWRFAGGDPILLARRRREFAVYES